MIYRRCSLLFAAVLLLTVWGLPQGASAQGADLTCAVSTHLNFEPGVTPTEETQQITGTMYIGTSMSTPTACDSPTGIPYQGGIAQIKGTGRLSCGDTGLVEEPTGTWDVTWDNGDTSTAEWRSTASVTQAEFTRGALMGATAIDESTLTAVTGDCFTEPMTRAVFNGTLHVSLPQP